MSTVQPEAYLFLIAGGCIILAGVAMLVLRAAEWFADRRVNRSQPRHWHMSSAGGNDGDYFDGETADDRRTTTTVATSNNAIAITQQERNALLARGQAVALAALVEAGKVGETEGIKIVYNIAPSSTSKKYQEARAMVREELDRLRLPALKEQRSHPSVVERKTA